MQHRWIAALVVAAFAAPAIAGSKDLSVSVKSMRQAVNAKQDVEVTVQYKNTGRDTLYLYKWFADRDVLKQPMFKVTLDGAAVSYLGREYKRRAPTLDDMIAIPAGRSVSRTFKLGDVYDMSKSGHYKVEFDTHASHMLAEVKNGKVSPMDDAADHDVRSSDVQMFVEGRESRIVTESRSYMARYLERSQVKASSISYAANCSSTRQSQISSGYSAASSYANESVTYLNKTPAATTRYVTWFGKFSTTNWNTAKSHFVKIKDAIDTKPLEFDCSCTETGTFAYVYPTQPYKIYLCGAYWAAANTGTDSRGGTIIHELSHFNIVAATDDHAYGQTAAKSLAKKNPARALDNADNHEYFAENTPFQN